MITAKDLQSYIGREGLFHIEAFSFGVTVLNARESYGRIQLRIVPVAGTGSKWVSETRVSFGNENGDK